MEGCQYDPDSGQLLTGSYMDYTMPRADDLPGFTVDLVQPFASIRLMAGPPTSHCSTLPSSVRTSSVIIGCGFSQAKPVTRPFTGTSFSKRTGQEMCAKARDGAQTRPEVGVLLSYAKIALTSGLLATDVPDEHSMQAFLTD